MRIYCIADFFIGYGDVFTLVGGGVVMRDRLVGYLVEYFLPELADLLLARLLEMGELSGCDVLSVSMECRGGLMLNTCAFVEMEDIVSGEVRRCMVSLLSLN